MKGKRIELHPCTDRWMMGDRYGEIVKVRDDCVQVKLDKSGKKLWFKQENIIMKPGL